MRVLGGFTIAFFEREDANSGTYQLGFYRLTGNCAYLSHRNIFEASTRVSVIVLPYMSSLVTPWEHVSRPCLMKSIILLLSVYTKPCIVPCIWGCIFLFLNAFLLLHFDVYLLYCENNHESAPYNEMNISVCAFVIISCTLREYSWFVWSSYSKYINRSPIFSTILENMEAFMIEPRIFV